MTFVFTTTDANRVSDTCDGRNRGSARVMEKAGLRLVEHLMDRDDQTGRWLILSLSELLGQKRQRIGEQANWSTRF